MEMKKPQPGWKGALQTVIFFQPMCAVHTFLERRCIQNQANDMEQVVKTAISGFANGRKPAPKRLIHTINIGEPQHPIRKQTETANPPVKVTPPIAMRPVVLHRVSK